MGRFTKKLLLALLCQAIIVTSAYAQPVISGSATPTPSTVQNVGAKTTVKAPQAKLIEFSNVAEEGNSDEHANLDEDLKTSDKKEFVPQTDLERLYNKPLKQFGYDVFSNAPSSAGISGVTRDYRLKTGDKVKIFFWGDTVDLMSMTGNALLEPVVTSVVDAEGNLFVPGAGVIPAEGNSLAGVESDIYSMVSSKYSNFNVKVTLEDPRNFSVLVVGNAKKPGVVSVNSSSTVIDALAGAGGISPIGSLRELYHVDAETGQRTVIDLYSLIAYGHPIRVSLTEGDVLLVRPIGKTVALADGVKNPAIYEFKTNETLKKIVDIAGGFMPNINPKHIQVEGFDLDRNQKYIQDITLSDLNNVLPDDGDILTFTTVYTKPENFVTLEGNVKHPNRFEFKDGMRLSDLIKKRDDLLENTFTSQAFIYRTVGLEKNVVTIPVDLTEFFSGTVDPVLQPKDLVKIFASTSISTVEIVGEVNNAGLFPLKDDMTLKDIFSLVGLAKNPNDLVAEISNDAIKSRFNSVYLYELLTQNKDDLNIDLLASDKIMIRPVTPKEVLKEVTVLGQVNSPGQLQVTPGMKLKDVLAQTGGLTDLAYLKGIIFLRPSVGATQIEILNKTILNLQEDITTKATLLGSLDGESKTDMEQFILTQQKLLSVLQEKAKQQYGRIVLDIDSSDNIDCISPTANLEIRDGDQVIIPAISNHVIVMGEVYNQSALAYIPGEKAKYYLKSVGGFTKKANKGEVYIIRANGRTEPPSEYKKVSIEPGDAIVVPKKIKVPGRFSETFRNIINAGFQAASMAFILTQI